MLSEVRHAEEKERAGLLTSMGASPRKAFALRIMFDFRLFSRPTALPIRREIIFLVGLGIAAGSYASLLTQIGVKAEDGPHER